MPMISVVPSPSWNANLRTVDAEVHDPAGARWRLARRVAATVVPVADVVDDGLFARRERSDRPPAGHLEGTYQFLDRVAGGYWQQVRDEMNVWVTHVPPRHRPDLAARLRSKNDDQFNAAYLELYLHETFIRLGLSVECHPEISGRRQPDFRVDDGDTSIYVEARHIVRRSDTERGQGQRTAAVYDALNEMDSPNFFVWIEVVTAGRQELGKRALRNAAEDWLGSLDPDHVNTIIRQHGIDRPAPFDWSNSGWHIRLRPIPKSADARGRPGVRPIGMFGGIEAEFVDSSTAIRSALDGKGTAYGITEEAFVLALGVDLFTGKDESNMASALYGSEQIVLRPDLDHVVRTGRAADGYWSGGGRWLHTNVSGVLQITNLHPAFFHRADATLWLHPAADHHVEPLPPWRCLRPIGTKLTPEPAAMSQSALFGVTADWPEGEPFPDD